MTTTYYDDARERFRDALSRRQDLDKLAASAMREQSVAAIFAVAEPDSPCTRFLVTTWLGRLYRDCIRAGTVPPQRGNDDS